MITLCFKLILSSQLFKDAITKAVYAIKYYSVGKFILPSQNTVWYIFSENLQALLQMHIHLKTLSL